VAPPAKRARWAVDDDLAYLLARASHVVASEFHLEVRAAGLTVLEWRVLATLAGGGAHSVGTLAALTLAQQSTVTKLIGRLEAEGRVARSDGDVDRRRSMVRITPAGRAALKSLRACSKRHESAALERLGDDAAASLKSALRKLIASR
jgi:MarR family transcriptional regulator, organic hydroperoxide resistance regulator